MTILTMTCWPCVSKCKVPLVCCCCCPLESWWRVSGAGTWPGTSPSCGWSGPSCCGCASPPPGLWWPPLRGGACRSHLPVGWDRNVISTPWIPPFWTFKTDWSREKLPYFTIIPHIWGKFHIFLAASLNLLCDWYMWLLNLHCGFYCHSKIFWTQTLNLQVNTILFMIESLYWSAMTSVAMVTVSSPDSSWQEIPCWGSCTRCPGTSSAAWPPGRTGLPHLLQTGCRSHCHSSWRPPCWPPSRPPWPGQSSPTARSELTGENPSPRRHLRIRKLSGVFSPPATGRRDKDNKMTCPGRPHEWQLSPYWEGILEQVNCT